MQGFFNSSNLLAWAESNHTGVVEKVRQLCVHYGAFVAAPPPPPRGMLECLKESIVALVFLIHIAVPGCTTGSVVKQNDEVSPPTRVVHM